MFVKDTNGRWINVDHTWRFHEDHSAVDTSKWALFAALANASTGGLAAQELAGLYDTQADAIAANAVLVDKVDRGFDPATLA
jgi:hypothetical protein